MTIMLTSLDLFTNCVNVSWFSVFAGNLLRLGLLLDRAVDQKNVVGQFAAAFRGIDEERADAAVYIDHGIGFRRAGIVGEFIERVAALVQILG